MVPFYEHILILKYLISFVNAYCLCSKKTLPTSGFSFVCFSCVVCFLPEIFMFRSMVNLKFEYDV